MSSWRLSKIAVKTRRADVALVVFIGLFFIAKMVHPYYHFEFIDYVFVLIGFFIALVDTWLSWGRTRDGVSR
jgi:hypothetical protein